MLPCDMICLPSSRRIHTCHEEEELVAQPRAPSDLSKCIWNHREGMS